MKKWSVLAVILVALALPSVAFAAGGCCPTSACCDVPSDCCN